MEKLLNLIFIPECIFCKSIGAFFCEECLKKCDLINRSITLDKVRMKFWFGFEYHGLVRECIRNAKYRNRHFAALKDLTRRAAELLKNNKTLVLKNNLVIPIPATKFKLKSRGFNQAQIIAEIFSKTLKMPIHKDVLLRVKETTSQYANNKKERFRNMKSAFGIKNSEKLNGVNILLVDDICTTGATFLEAAKTLFLAGALSVTCIAIARKTLVKV